MAAKKSEEPASGASSSRRGGRGKRRPRDKQTAGAPLRVDVPGVQTAEEWQRTFDAVSDPIAILDTQHRMVRVNKAMADRLGLTKDQCVGQTCYRLVHGTDEPPAFCPHARLLQDGEEHTVEVHIERLAGDFLVTASPLRDSTGHLVGSVRVARDITERKQAEAALLESEARFRQLFEHMSSGVAVYEAVDDGGDFVFKDLNESGEQIEQVRREEVVGRRVTEVFPGVAEFGLLEVFRRVWRTGSPERHPVSRYQDLRIVGWRENYVFKLPSDEVVAVYDDRTEQKQAEQTLRDSERRFRDLAGLLPQTVYEIDLQGRLTFVNRWAFETFGYTETDLEGGVTCFDMLAPGELGRARRNIEAVLQGQRLGGTEYTARRKDGTQFPVAIYSSPIVHDGAPVGLRGIIVDVTERKQAEEVLRQAHIELNQIYNAAAPLSVIDTDYKILRVNDTFCRMFGVKRENVLGKACHEICQNARCGTPECSLRTILNGTAQAECDTDFRLHTGRTISCVVTSTPFRGPDGKLIGIVRSHIDITDRKRAEEALRSSERVRAEAEKLAATGRTAARVAHEINNPLAGIKNSFILVKDAVPKDHPDYDLVGRIEKEIDRISRIVRQMYKLYSTDEEPPRDICVAETIREVVLMLQPSWRENDVRVDVNTPDPALSARIPEGSLRQVLYNVVENAIEASPQGGVVKISATKAEEGIRISISDQGGGIPPDLQERVFEPFFSTKHGPRTCGMGLGLSIVREIVGALKGTIEFRSTRGQGTVFEVVLPI